MSTYNFSDKKHNRTILPVVRNGYCTGCGTCVAMCPKSAVEMSINIREGLYSPELDEEKCSFCGLCYECCPGHQVDFKLLNSEIYGKEPVDIWLGNYLHCYVGHSNDYEIRFNSSSGGLITQLLIFALETGMIDGALVTKMDERNPLEPKPFIARTKEELISAAKSKYCPVPANIQLKHILKENGKFAIVGLPCHIHGIRKAEKAKRILREKIILHFGLFCSHTVDFRGTELLLRKIGVDKRQVLRIDYRGRGWPGGLLIKLRKESEKFIPLEDYYMFNYFLFSPKRCCICSDPLAELADISFGDPWLPEMNREKTGKSLVISRSQIGQKILQNTENEGWISLLEINPDVAMHAQRGIIFLKKKCFKMSVLISRIFRHVVPNFNQKKTGISFHTDWIVALVHMNSFISSHTHTRPFASFLVCIPLRSIITFNRYVTRIISSLSYIIEKSQLRRARIAES